MLRHYCIKPKVASLPVQIEEVKSCLQGWQSMGDPCRVQLFGACNLPWLDRTFQLAPPAGLNTGERAHHPSEGGPSLKHAY